MRKGIRAAALIAVMLMLGIPGLAVAQPAPPPLLQTIWEQGFEEDTEGWIDAEELHPGTGEPWFGSVTRVASGTGGIDAASDGFYAEFEGHPTLTVPYNAHTGPFTPFDGFSSVWPGLWVAEVAVYIDPAAFEIGEGFDYAVATNRVDGSNLRDFIFNTAKQANGNYAIAVSNGSLHTPSMDLEARPHYIVTEAGWYIFQHVFRDAEGVLAVDLNLLNDDRLVLFQEDLSAPEDTIPAVVGGNRYGWFVFISPDISLPVDQTQRQVPDTTFPVDIGALSARGAEVSGPVGVQTIEMRGAITTTEIGRARFEATIAIELVDPILGCRPISSADFTITFTDGTVLTAAIDADSWTNFGMTCDFLGTGIIAIVASVDTNTSGYTALEQTIAFGIESLEYAPDAFAWKGNFLNGPVPPPTLTPDV